MTIDEAPLNGFHLRVAAYTTGGYFVDGYILGMIGIALALLAPQLAPQLGFFPQAPVTVILILSSLFAFVIEAAADRESVYPAEIFPTEVRASVTGVAAAIGTFLLPTSVEQFGKGPTMFAATAVLLLGVVLSVAWAPETRHVALSEANMAGARPAHQQ